MRNVKLLILYLVSVFPVFAQQSHYNVFPIAKGNLFNYQYQFYDTTYYVGSFESTQKDSGAIKYLVIDSVNTGDKIEWYIEAQVNLQEHYYIPSNNIDTSYLIETIYNFILTESLSGNHELTANPPSHDSLFYWGNLGIWRFPILKEHPIILPVFRFNDKPGLVLSNDSPGFLDSLWFDINRGLYKRVYKTKYIGNHQIYTHMYIDLKNITTGVIEDKYIISPNFHLHPNYPNPFNPVTTIEYSVPELSNVVVKVYDILGREISTLVSEEKPAGNYKVIFNGIDLASGVYFYKLETEKFIETKKLILLK